MRWGNLFLTLTIKLSNFSALPIIPAEVPCAVKCLGFMTWPMRKSLSGYPWKDVSALDCWPAVGAARLDHWPFPSPPLHLPRLLPLLSSPKLPHPTLPLLPSPTPFAFSLPSSSSEAYPIPFSYPHPHPHSPVISPIRPALPLPPSKVIRVFYLTPRGIKIDRFTLFGKLYRRYKSRSSILNDFRLKFIERVPQNDVWASV